MTETQTLKPGGTAAQFLTDLHLAQVDLWWESLDGCAPEIASVLAARCKAAFEGGYLTVDYDLGVYVMTVKGREYVETVARG